MSRKRCRCHPSAYYATCIECPRCHHYSFDPIAESCERRKCVAIPVIELPDIDWVPTDVDGIVLYVPVRDGKLL
jgi:hypothetical protein